MRDLLLEEFTGALDRMIEYFPHQPQWQRLKQNFIHEYEAYKNIYATVNNNDMCQCCGRAPVDQDVFCSKCLVLFSKHSSDIIVGQCDCGHLPQGSDIFLFSCYGRLHSLCGIECVKKYYQKLFGPLLRRLK